MSPSIPQANEFSGHIRALLAKQPGEKPLQEDIDDNIDGEKETIPNLTEDDLRQQPDQNPGPFAAKWRASITSASKGVTEKTDSEYQRLAKQCAAFLISHQLIKTAEEFLCPNPPNDSDVYIISWIMQECDEISLEGSHKPVGTVCSKYTHAQKMWASMTHIFGRDFGLGKQDWTKNERTGRMMGNPSTSHLLGTYMVSLRNRKVRAGDVATSARAITPEILQKLYHYNHRSENWDLNKPKAVPSRPGAPSESQPKSLSDPSTSRIEESIHIWGGPLTRRALQAIYTLAFICLLRLDEVLKIRRDHIEFVKEDNDIQYMVLTLPFRKTHQDGHVQPFYIYPLDEEEAHLCPVRAMAQWIKASKVTSGFLFRRFTAQDR